MGCEIEEDNLCNLLQFSLVPYHLMAKLGLCELRHLLSLQSFSTFALSSRD